MKDFSLQLYSLREVPTLRQRMEIAAQAGYTGVEFAGYDGIAGPEMRRLLASLGLRGTGSHIALRRAAGRFGRLRAVLPGGGDHLRRLSGL